MDYIETTIELTPFNPFNEIVVAALSEIGYESFIEVEAAFQVKAYIPEVDYSEEAVKIALAPFSEMAEYRINSNLIAKENWNKKWEENFDSVSVGKFCYVKAPFHPVIEGFKYTITIEPKMSFGTGHHQTTQMMIELMETIDFKNSKVLDMGSGTGILAILAQKMQATHTDAVDIEDWAYVNMKENFERNGVEVKAYLGGVEVVENIHYQFDSILANINKNILLNQFETYNSKLKKGGNLLLSGFYEPDAPDLLSSRYLNNFREIKRKTKDGWCALHLQKI